MCEPGGPCKIPIQPLAIPVQGMKRFLWLLHLSIAFVRPVLPLASLKQSSQTAGFPWPHELILALRRPMLQHSHAQTSRTHLLKKITYWEEKKDKKINFLLHSVYLNK